MSTRRQLILLVVVLIGGMSVVAVVSIGAVFLIRREIAHLSQETSPTQVKLAKLQRGFERISGSFSRISAASTLAELSGVESELGQTMIEVQSIAKELAASAGSGGAESGVIKDMARTGEQLLRMSHQRIEARKRIAEANHNVTAEIESVATATMKLSAAMGQLQESSQRALVSSKQTSLDANTAIRALLVEREKIEQLRSSLQEVRLIDKKFRLNPLRDKVGGVLDSMVSQELPDKSLAARVKSFAGSFAAGINGDTGLLAARAAMLAAPQDEKVKNDFEARQKSLTSASEELSRQIAAAIDPLELAVANANAGMNRATELIAEVASISAASAEVKARGRSIQALGWELLAASDAASVDRMAGQIAQQCDEVSKSLASILEGLSRLDRSPDRGAVESARKSFSSVRELLIGPAGVASAVREGLDTQRQAEGLFSASIGSIRQVALAGSKRAHDAEGAQEQAVARIQSFSAGTFLLVGVVALAALVTGLAVGRRVGNDILAAEERQLNDAGKMRQVVERMSTSARTLRVTSRGLTDASELVTRNVETIAAGAGHMQSSIHSIAASASEASAVGGGAATLVESAASAVGSLQNASSEIGKVTEMIRSIAFKTNLLALNAAVEAAHAGQFGAGFSVVADEVKKLSQSAAEFTAAIDSRIAAMSNQVDNVTASMTGVTSIIQRIRGMQDTIAAAVREQTATTEQITASIAETATGCRGDSSRQGIHAMSLQLAGLAEDLESLCQVPATEP
jgi:Methyl-accepting chemotaxis protein (MCP) signalling domain